MELVERWFTYVESPQSKPKSEELKCSYLMAWVGDKGREKYSTWELEAEEATKLSQHVFQYEAQVKPNRIECLQGTSSTRKFNRTVGHWAISHWRESYL